MLRYDDNAVKSVSADMPADSNAMNPNNIVNVDSADTSPNDAKNYTFDDFLCCMYSPGTASQERPNMQGLYGKGRGV